MRGAGGCEAGSYERGFPGPSPKSPLCSWRDSPGSPTTAGIYSLLIAEKQLPDGHSSSPFKVFISPYCS